MNSGTSLKQFKQFDYWFGAHQKIDRVARRNLLWLLGKPAPYFPSSKAIRHFEGINGPDGIKVKSVIPEEPWHFYDPYNPDDKKILVILKQHYDELVAALCRKDTVRASFEAAWLAHAMVDGLTPAHHFPYKEELLKLHGGEHKASRSIKSKLVIPGESLSVQVRNNWKMWGDKGLVSSHLAFEMGIATMIIPLQFTRSQPSPADVAELESVGYVAVFKSRARQIADLKMYDTFCDTGWTPRLAKQVRRELIPIIINTVTLTWYSAAKEAATPIIEDKPSTSAKRIHAKK